MESFYDKWGCHSNDIPLSPPVRWGQGILQKQLPFTALQPPSVIHRGVALITSQILRMDLVDFFVRNTFQSGEEKGRGWGGRHFQPKIISVCVCVSQKCGSAAQLHFMGKSVSHHCVLSGCQTLTGLVGCCAVCVLELCVESRRCWFQRAAREQAEFRSCWSPEVTAGCSSSVSLPFWTGTTFSSFGCGVLTSCFWFRAWRLPA